MGTRGSARRWLAPVLALVLYAAFASGTMPASATKGPAPRIKWSRSRPDVIVGVATSERVVALSFDDGPDPRWTPSVLDILDRLGAKATFFLEGGHVDAHPALARAVAERGHEIANHTYDHPEMDVLDADTVADQIVRANASFAAAGLPAPTLFRPPKGVYPYETAIGVRAAGLMTAGWTGGLCIEKWVKRPAGIDGMLARVRPGAILLGHDGGTPDRAATVKALPLLLEGLRAQGYRVVSVTELLSVASAPARRT